MEPATQLAPAHRGRGSIEHSRQRAIGSVGEAGGKLQIAARRCIEQHRLAALLRAQATQVRQRRFLRIAYILQEAAGCRDRERSLRAAEARQVARLKLLTQRARRCLQVEVPRRALASERRNPRGRRLLGHEQLGRPQPLDLARERFAALRFEHAEAAARQFEPSEAEAIALAAQGGEQLVAALFQERLVRHRAWRYHAYHLAFDRALRFGRVADLLADRHRFAAPHELGEVAFDAVERHARHRDRLAGRLTACGQRDVEQPRRALRVVEEQLVKVAHAIEQQRVRVLRLQAQVLLHHGSVGFEGGGHSGDSLQATAALLTA